ncbi:HAD family hydrolase [Mycoplasma sp. P36-A1]|uniref:HAD family hydrolase n=1 Tax=Mycoplasma sp. P36-A1 TaxID=3252900 RepID=UPI003C2D613A
MINKIKIAFFDMDGTLFDHSRKIVSKEVIEGLKKLKENGVILCIATGRPYEMLNQVNSYIDEIDFDYLITSNGQSIYEKRKLVYRNFLDKEDVKTIIKIAKKHNLTLNLVGDNTNIVTKKNDLLNISCESVGFECPTVTQIGNDFDRNVDHAVIYEPLTYRKYFVNKLKNSVITYWSSDVFEFTPDNGVKIHGIKILLKQLEIDKDNAIAFGDGANDVEMLEYVGFGVAMKNATDYVKEHADYITDDVQEDGVLTALQKTNLI